jgi:hypothetical protein
VSLKVVRGAEEREVEGALEGAMLFALVWAFEACLPSKARAFFNILVRQMCARSIKYNVVSGYAEQVEPRDCRAGGPSGLWWRGGIGAMSLDS